MIFLAPVIPIIAVTATDLLIAAGVIVAGSKISAAWQDRRNASDSKAQKKKSRAEQRQEDQAGATEMAKREQEQDQTIETLKRHVNDQRFFRVVIALANVGYAYLREREGAVSDEKNLLIHDFLIGQVAQHLPERYAAALNECRKNPVSLAAAHQVLVGEFPEAIAIANSLVQLLTEMNGVDTAAA